MFSLISLRHLRVGTLFLIHHKTTRRLFMKKVVIFLVIGILLVSGAVFAQTTQAASNPNQQQDTQNEDFARGGYSGPSLAILAIGDLADTAPNEFVIVEGYLIQQRIPGTFILADSPKDPTATVIVRFNSYSWSNLTITAETPVLIYGTVNRSELRIEIEGTRIEIQR
jgi:uncharacterized protein YdeI (BOF family)